MDQKVIFAARGCNLELLKERIACGGNINYQDTKYGSALISAINNSDFPMVLFLIENGADVNAENAYGIVPLEVALQQSTDEIVRILAWSGARLKSRSRPHWRERLELCLRNS
ncbi:ankyrin repeat domain-containing protein [Pseudoalteromonas sp. GB56]